MPDDVVLQVAKTLQGEASWIAGQLLVACCIVWRSQMLQYNCGLTGDAAVLCALRGFNGYNPNPTRQALEIATYVVESPDDIWAWARHYGIDLGPEPFGYVMGQIDVDEWGWVDGEVVAYNPGVPGEAVHLFAEWPTKRDGQLTNYFDRIPEGV